VTVFDVTVYAGLLTLLGLAGFVAADMVLHALFEEAEDAE